MTSLKVHDDYDIKRNDVIPGPDIIIIIKKVDGSSNSLSADAAGCFFNTSLATDYTDYHEFNL